MNVLKTLRKWLGGSLKSQTSDQALRIISSHLNKFFPACPACQTTFRAHRFGALAITIFNQSHRNRVDDFLDAVRRGDWRKACAFDEFDPFEDALVLQVVKCPSRRAIWLLTREPHNLDDPFEILEYRVLDVSESANLLSTAESALRARIEWIELI